MPWSSLADGKTELDACCQHMRWEYVFTYWLVYILCTRSLLKYYCFVTSANSQTCQDCKIRWTWIKINWILWQLKHLREELLILKEKIKNYREDYRVRNSVLYVVLCTQHSSRQEGWWVKYFFLISPQKSMMWYTKSISERYVRCFVEKYEKH